MKMTQKELQEILSKHQTNLCDADLSSTFLIDADIGEAYFNDETLMPFIPFACPDSGSFIGYKKAHGCIVVLEIPKDALRSSATTSKCRCDKAKVLRIEDLSGNLISGIGAIPSDRDTNFIYKVGEVIKVDNFDTDRWHECSTGIHFFINKQEAVNY